MITHWAHEWIAFQYNDQLAITHGEGADGIIHALIELHVVHETTEVSPDSSSTSPEEIQYLRDQFVFVFEEPTGFPLIRLQHIYNF
jgi:hypothetical protein